MDALSGRLDVEEDPDVADAVFEAISSLVAAEEERGRKPEGQKAR